MINKKQDEANKKFSHLGHAMNVTKEPVNQFDSTVRMMSRDNAVIKLEELDYELKGISWHAKAPVDAIAKNVLTDSIKSMTAAQQSMVETSEELEEYLIEQSTLPETGIPVTPVAWTVINTSNGVIDTHRFATTKSDTEHWLGDHPKNLLKLLPLYAPEEPADTPESQEWVDGLPPIGVKFAFSYNKLSWENRVIIFNDGITLLMAHAEYPRNRWMYKCDDPSIYWRPIQTAEQKAADERESVVKAARAELEQVKKELARVNDGLSAIQQYGRDTLTGPSKRIDDTREWQRGAVVEMLNRAGALINGDEWDFYIKRAADKEPSS